MDENEEILLRSVEYLKTNTLNYYYDKKHKKDMKTLKKLKKLIKKGKKTKYLEKAVDNDGE